MPRILEHKTQGVTLGVTDKDLRLVPELQSVTFTDYAGTPHTVHAHVDGPFSTPDDIVAAYEAGTLHTFQTHEQAVEFARLRDDHVTATNVQALIDSERPADNRQEGDE